MTLVARGLNSINSCSAKNKSGAAENRITTPLYYIPIRYSFKHNIQTHTQTIKFEKKRTPGERSANIVPQIQIPPRSNEGGILLAI